MRQARTIATPNRIASWDDLSKIPEVRVPDRYCCLNPACAAPQNSPDATVCEACGSSLILRDRYRALSLLGQGGFGATFLAVDLALPGNPLCALKQLRPGSKSDRDLAVARKLFAREAETLGTIGSHPQIPRLLDYFELDEQFYLIQEYVEGQTLAQEVKQQGPFDEPALIDFLKAILPCIDYIHSHRVIHRDIKPQNIIRRRTDRQLVLIDFGAVRYAMAQYDGDDTLGGPLTESAVWTPGYSAPEQMALRPVFASDLYSLGVTCLFLLTGKPPQSLGFDPETGLIDWHREVRISGRLASILHKMLEIAPRDRFGAARDVLHALDPEVVLSDAVSTPPWDDRVSEQEAGLPTKSSAPELDFEPTEVSGSADTEVSLTEANAPVTNAVAAVTNGLAASQQQDDLSGRNRTRVLVVQDVPILARSLARKLVQLGYSVVDVLSSVLTARDRAATESPDIILMELSLAGNPDVAAAAVEIYEQCQIPTIYLARHEGEELLESARHGKTYYGHVFRPYPDRDLQAAIEAALSTHYRQLRDRVSRESSYGQQLRLAEETLNYLIYHDRGTGLPNHLSLREQFSQALKRRHLDTLGGDVASLPVGCLGLETPEDPVALQAVARDLKTHIGADNSLAYLGDGRFAIVWATTPNQDAIAAAADRLLQQLQAAGHGFSLGVACNWQQSLSIDRLLSRAQTALDAARSQGKSHAFYGTHLETACGPDSEQILLEKELSFALARGELQVHYQPRLDLRQRQLTGVEALVRWFHPRLGKVAPSRFLPVAEDLGLMAPIGEWVCRQASQQVRQWQIRYDLPLVLAVNLDNAQFVATNLDRNLAGILSTNDFDPHLLELEVTESLLVSDPQRAQQQLRALRALGIKIAIDDFGTGYASLSYLRQFPFDILKIDRCFVQNLHADEKNGAIAVAIAQMAASLNLQVVAEGVETEDELAFLQQYPCDAAQGYLFSPPLPADRFENWLGDRRRRRPAARPLPPPPPAPVGERSPGA